MSILNKIAGVPLEDLKARLTQEREIGLKASSRAAESAHSRARYEKHLGKIEALKSGARKAPAWEPRPTEWVEGRIRHHTRIAAESDYASKHKEYRNILNKKKKRILKDKISKHPDHLPGKPMGRNAKIGLGLLGATALGGYALHRYRNRYGQDNQQD